MNPSERSNLFHVNMWQQQEGEGRFAKKKDQG